MTAAIHAFRPRHAPSCGSTKPNADSSPIGFTGDTDLDDLIEAAFQIGLRTMADSDSTVAKAKLNAAVGRVRWRMRA